MAGTTTAAHTGAEEFGVTARGEMVHRVTLQGGGLTARFITYGASLQDLRLEGVDHPLVLGAETLAPYEGPMRYYGAMVGRVANRIANARFRLDGKTYEVDANEKAATCLHGGARGSGARVWRIEELSPSTVVMSLMMSDGDMGFPGCLCVRLTFSLGGKGLLEIACEARCDAPTPCSFAHHSLFNLDGTGSVLDHEMRIEAARYLPIDARSIPLDPAAVEGTEFDYRTARPIAMAGLDHNYCLTNGPGPLRPAAWVRGPQSGVTLELETTEPGLQVYSGGHITGGGPAGLQGVPYGPNAGLALEPQAWPDAVNRPDFPSCILRPGAHYRQRTRLRFARS